MVDSTSHLVVKGEQKKFDTAEEAEQAWKQNADGNSLDCLTTTKRITLGGNSYGYAACEWVAQTLDTRETPELKEIDFSNIFVSRLRAELPKSLEIMANVLVKK